MPDPEPDWLSALQYQGRERNPARQYFTFDQAVGDFREIACLRVDIADIARRLRLLLEPGNTDLGPVDAAFFSIDRVGFAVYRHTPEEFTFVCLHRKGAMSQIDAMDKLLGALRIDWRAVATVVFGEGRDRRFVEPVLDGDLRPTFPEVVGEA